MGGGGLNKFRLGDVVEILDNERRPITKKDREKGIYPYYGANGIQDHVANYIFDGNFLLLGEDGSVINKNRSPVLTWATGKIWVNNHAHVLKEKSDSVLLRYIFYYLQTIDVSPIVRGVPPKINQKDLREIEIHIPDVDTQHRIIKILDKLESIVNDISKGLPAEIEARRKQYEYYRDKLLSFKELKHEFI